MNTPLSFQKRMALLEQRNSKMLVPQQVLGIVKEMVSNRMPLVWVRRV